MKFKYKRYSKEIIRPVIPIEISYNGREIAYEALVDSGADACIFDAQLGEALGINISAGEENRVSGITGALESYFVHPVTIRVGGFSFDIEAGFLPNIAKMGYGIIGQKGFFDLFIVKFDYKKEEIELKNRK
jgi:hypothetical protein